MSNEVTDVAFRAEARAWLEANAELRKPTTEWGVGSDSVAVFLDLTPEEERELVAARQAWERRAFDAGFGAAVGAAPEHGGRGLPARYAGIYHEEEADFETPVTNELFAVTQALIAPTVAAWGTPEQRARFVAAFLRTDLLCCQLFSEPGAGSDLASLQTKAVRDGNEWVLSGQKVWTSGAMVADFGEAVCRSDPAAPKHAGMTAFLVPLDAPGVTIRPIRQMTGGASFNEVFLDEVRVPDDLRLGGDGDGWKVALTTLSAERHTAGELGSGMVDRVLALARRLGRTGEPAVRQRLVDLWIRATIQSITGRRIAGRLAAGQEPGPESSFGKLAATQNLTRTGEVAASLLGPRLAADTGEWGTFAWSELVLGAPGYRIAGGSDEIQRTIVAERVLGLPREPRGR